MRDKTQRDEILACTCLLLCMLLFALVLPRLVPYYNYDFWKGYYLPARVLLDTGTFTYTYDAEKLAPYGATRIWDYNVTSNPIAIISLTPFALRRPELGGQLFMAFNLASYIVAFILSVRSFAVSARDVWILLFLFVSSTAIRTSVELGQLTPFTFLLIVMAIVTYLKGHKGLSSALVAVAFIVKIPAGVLSLLFVRRWNLGGMAWATAVFLSLVTLSIALLGIDVHKDFWYSVIADLSGKTMIAHNNQSVFAFITRFFYPPSFYDWTPVPVPTLIYQGLILAIVAWVGYLCARVLRSNDWSAESVRREFSLLICTALIIFPISWDHYHLFLIIPFYCLYELLKRTYHPMIWTSAVISFVLVNLPEFVLTWPGWRPDCLRLAIVSAPFAGCVFLLATLAWAHLYLRSQEEHATDMV
jgi:hypothetical protein